MPDELLRELLCRSLACHGPSRRPELRHSLVMLEVGGFRSARTGTRASLPCASTPPSPSVNCTSSRPLSCTVIWARNHALSLNAPCCEDAQSTRARHDNVMSLHQDVRLSCRGRADFGRSCFFSLRGTYSLLLVFCLRSLSGCLSKGAASESCRTHSLMIMHASVGIRATSFFPAHAV
jgi:hypothetical protein